MSDEWKVVKKVRRTLPFVSAVELEETAAKHVVENLNQLFSMDGNVLGVVELFLETRDGIHAEQHPAYEQHIRAVMGFIVSRGIEAYATQFDEMNGRELDNEIECAVDDMGVSRLEPEDPVEDEEEFPA